MNIDEVVFEEVGEENSDQLSVNPNNIGQAVIWGTDWTTETINTQMVKGNIDLTPKFQRRDAWNNSEKSCLIESLMLGIPVPPIILAESKTKRNTYIVIDGKQRLLSIRRFYAEKQILDSDQTEEFKPLKLSGLAVLKELNGKTKNQINNDYITNLENQAIRTVIIKNWPDEEFLYTVFLRLNTGSKKLSPQELRQALKPGDFLSYLDDATAASSTMRKMLRTNIADPRMRDIELALRFYAFKYFVTSFNGNLKEFLDYTCEQLNMRWAEDADEFKKDFSALESAIDFSYSLMENDSPFSRYSDDNSSNRFNRSIYELFSFYFSIEEIRNAIDCKKSEFILKFKELNNNPEFISAVSDTTKSPIKVVARFSLFADVLKEFYSAKIPTLELQDNKISLVHIGG